MELLAGLVVVAAVAGVVVLVALGVVQVAALEQALVRLEARVAQLESQCTTDNGWNTK